MSKPTWPNTLRCLDHVGFFFAGSGLRPREKDIMGTIEVIILVVVLVFLFGGGGYFYSRR